MVACCCGGVLDVLLLVENDGLAAVGGTQGRLALIGGLFGNGTKEAVSTFVCNYINIRSKLTVSFLHDFEERCPIFH